MSNLQTLDLHSNYIGPTGAGTLSEYLAGMPGLKALHLGLNIIGDDGAVALAAGLKAMHKLQTLTLCDNGIGALGLAALAGSLCELPNLQVRGRPLLTQRSCLELSSSLWSSEMREVASIIRLCSSQPLQLQNGGVSRKRT